MIQRTIGRKSKQRGHKTLAKMPQTLVDLTKRPPTEAGVENSLVDFPAMCVPSQTGI